MINFNILFMVKIEDTRGWTYVFLNIVGVERLVFFNVCIAENGLIGFLRDESIEIIMMRYHNPLFYISIYT